MRFTDKRSRRQLLGEFSQDQYGLFQSNSSTISSVLDIGANVGLFSFLARVKHPRARIAAVEPSSKTFCLLKENLEGMSVETHRIALGDTGTACMISAGKTSICTSFDNGESGGESCQSMSLPDMMSFLSLQPDGLLLKIDCEGAERHMVGDKDSENILKKSSLLMMELHLVDGKISLDDYLKWISGVVSPRPVDAKMSHKLLRIRVS